MNEQPKNPAMNSPFSFETWETVNRYIGGIESSVEEMDENIMLMHVDDLKTSDKRTRFEALINQTPASGVLTGSTVLAQWAKQPFEHHWLNGLHEAWNHAVQSIQKTQRAFQPNSFPIYAMMHELANGLTPAPAVRNAHVLQDQVYAPKRRAIDASGLPVFNPLFCTAIDSEIEPILLNGLTPNTQYRLTLRGIAQPDWLHETTLTSTDHGTCEIAFADILRRYEESNPDRTQTAWVLRKLHSNYASGWTSGVVWLESVQGLSRRTSCGGEGTIWQDHTDQEFRTLIEINLLLARGRYVEAYDQARIALLFARRHDLAPDSLYIASLWQFCRQSIHEMIRILQAGLPVFHQIVPGWDAVASLEELYTQITPHA